MNVSGALFLSLAQELKLVSGLLLFRQQSVFAPLAVFLFSAIVPQNHRWRHIISCASGSLALEFLRSASGGCEVSFWTMHIFNYMIFISYLFDNNKKFEK